MKTRQPIKRRKLSLEVKERLLDMIQTGELKEGDTMPSEHEIMDRYGVGRPAVREALQAMENMGLISIQHGEKAKVKKVSAEDVLFQMDATTKYLLSRSEQNVEQLREARQVFEVGVVTLATKMATPDCIAKLQEKLDHMRQCIGDHPRFMQADQSFHSTIAEITGNPILFAASKAMFRWLSEFHDDEQWNLLGVPELENLALEEHEAIFERILNRDPSGAVKALSDHILRANTLYNQKSSQDSKND